MMVVPQNVSVLSSHDKFSINHSVRDYAVYKEPRQKALASRFVCFFYLGLYCASVYIVHIDRLWIVCGWIGVWKGKFSIWGVIWNR